MDMEIVRPGDERSGSLSPAMYNFTIGLTLVWGFVINWLMVANISPEAIAQIPQLVFFIGYFACCMLGIYLFKSSDKPLVSFIGYNLVVIPFGLVINLVVSQYDPVLVYDALRVTTLVTVGMMCLGSLFPAFFQRLAPALTIALLLVIIVELVEVFIFNIHHPLLDWAVAVIFCGYIAYDWSQANSLPRTLDNAIDSAAALYMDIINLFLRILRIMGRNR
ncbi:Bax inhibitor-1 family protein [Pseudaeromonas sharmana]|uniref:Bax inhibitor-1 family protein n=1 Tax=Pseudaeromonas sharmana TaxID=328412 RepID=A0ABV8CQQ5_9GAMM